MSTIKPRRRRKSAPKASARGLPLGLQYVWTSLACASFAAAMLCHPAARGAVSVDIVTRDPRRLEEGETESSIHVALRLPSGEMLDAEGIRSFEALCADFGMDPKLSEARVEAGFAPDTWSVEAKLTRRIATLCGWDSGAPRAADIATATSDFDAACDEFQARGGMAVEPRAMLEAYIRELELSRTRTVGDVIRLLAESWVADAARPGITSAEDITGEASADFAEAAEEILFERFGDGLDVEIVHSDLVAAEHSLYGRIWDERYHAFIRVGDTYFDAETPGGVQDPLAIPFMRRTMADAPAAPSYR